MPWEQSGVFLDRSTIDFFLPPKEAHTASPEHAFRLSGMNSHYAHMYVDDVSLGVLPISGEVRSRHLPSALLGVDEAKAAPEILQRMIAAAFSPRDGTGRLELSHAFSEWGRYCTAALLRDGEAVYEVAYILASEGGNPVGFRVVPVAAGSIVRRLARGGNYVQRIPAGATLRTFSMEGRDRTPTKSEIALDDSRIVRVTLPPDLRHARDAGVALISLGENLYPDFFIPKPDLAPSQQVPFDFPVYKRTQEAAVATVTKRSGWYARGSFNAHVTEFYSMMRRVRFERMLIGLRDLLFLTANEILDRAGTRLQFKAQLSPQGLPTFADVLEVEAGLKAGTIPAAQVLERFRIH